MVIKCSVPWWATRSQKGNKKFHHQTCTCTGFATTGFWCPCPSWAILFPPKPNKIPSAKTRIITTYVISDDIKRAVMMKNIYICITHCTGSKGILICNQNFVTVKTALLIISKLWLWATRSELYSLFAFYFTKTELQQILFMHFINYCYLSVRQSYTENTLYWNSAFFTGTSCILTEILINI